MNVTVGSAAAAACRNDMSARRRRKFLGFACGFDPARFLLNPNRVFSKFSLYISIMANWRAI